jgi:serine protease Do
LLAGSTNSFRIIRDGKEQTIRVTVRARDDRALANTDLDPARANMKPPRPSADDVKVSGGTIRALNAEEVKKFDVGAAGAGLIVVTVEPRGPLARSDIFPGDAILEINNKAVKTPKDYQDAVAAAIAAGKRDVIARVGCGSQERCGDLTVLRPIEIAAAE